MPTEPIPRFALLDAFDLEAQAEWEHLTLAAADRLMGIDRVLRSLAVAGWLDREAGTGWALSGGTALLGVWLPSRHIMRVPDELALAPLSTAVGSGAVRPRQELAAAAASALPDGAAADDPVDAEVSLLSWSGVSGPLTLRLRGETKPLHFAPSAEARVARVARPGYVWDPRLGYRSGVDRARIPVPTAMPEELVLRLVMFIAEMSDASKILGRPDVVARADDLRLICVLEPTQAAAALSGAVRERMLDGLRARLTEAAQREAFLARVAERVLVNCEKLIRPGAIPAADLPDGRILDEAGRERGIAAIRAAFAGFGRA